MFFSFLHEGIIIMLWDMKCQNLFSGELGGNSHDVDFFLEKIIKKLFQFVC